MGVHILHVVVFLLASVYYGGIHSLPAGRPVAPSGDITGFTRGLLEKDDNNAAHLVSVDHQMKTNGPTAWIAPRPLLTVDRAVDNSPTVRLLKDLFRSQGTDQAARKRFLDAIASTRVIRLAMDYLRSIGKFSGDLNEFKANLERLWFTQYNRGGEKSSAFRHVFMAEKKKRSSPQEEDEVNGLHSWLFYSVQQPDIKYMGWGKKRDFNNNKGSIVSVTYRWNSLLKKFGSMFVGTSPELEMAVYTTCFIAVGGDCKAELAGQQFTVRTVPFSWTTPPVILTAFPVI